VKFSLPYRGFSEVGKRWDVVVAERNKGPLVPRKLMEGKAGRRARVSRRRSVMACSRPEDHLVGCCCDIRDNVSTTSFAVDAPLPAAHVRWLPVPAGEPDLHFSTIDVSCTRLEELRYQPADNFGSVAQIVWQSSAFSDVNDIGVRWAFPARTPVDRYPQSLPLHFDEESKGVAFDQYV
jgi:hypothetical protein